MFKFYYIFAWMVPKLDTCQRRLIHKLRDCFWVCGFSLRSPDRRANSWAWNAAASMRSIHFAPELKRHRMDGGSLSQLATYSLRIRDNRSILAISPSNKWSLPAEDWWNTGPVCRSRRFNADVLCPNNALRRRISSIAMLALCVWWILCIDSTPHIPILLNTDYWCDTIRIA